MNDPNPYITPDASLDNEQDELYQPKIFSFNGRIGRLRYLAYAVGTSIVMMLLMLPIMGTTMLAGGLAGGEAGMGSMAILATLVFGVVFFVLAVMFGKRRLNDLNRSGWWYLLALVPVVSFFMAIYMIFFPGAEETNNFGSAPVANTLGVQILGWSMPALSVLGIAAAIIIPTMAGFPQ